MRMSEGAFQNAETVHQLYNFPAPHRLPTSDSSDPSYHFRKIYYAGDSDPDDCQLGASALQQAAHLRILLPRTAVLLKH